MPLFLTIGVSIILFRLFYQQSSELGLFPITFTLSYVKLTLIPKICALEAAQIAKLASITLVPPLLTLGWFHTSQNQNQVHREHFLHNVLLLTVSVAGGLLALYESQATSPVPFVTSIAATVATIGWILQRQSSFELSRKQHTLNVLVQMRQSEIFNQHKLHIFSEYPGSQFIAKDDAKKIYSEKNNALNYRINSSGRFSLPLSDSILFVCNYYEFISAGIRQGDLDEELMKKTLRKIIGNSYRKFFHFISSLQERDKKNLPTNKTFEHLTWLVCEKWKIYKPNADPTAEQI